MSGPGRLLAEASEGCTGAVRRVSEDHWLLDPPVAGQL